MIGAVGNAPAEINSAALIAISLILIGGLALVAWWNGRSSSGRTANPIRVVASRMVGGKRWLTLVEVQGERLLLATGGDQITLLRSFASDDGKSCACSTSPAHSSRQSPPHVLSRSIASVQRMRRFPEMSGNVAQGIQHHESEAESSPDASAIQGSRTQQ